MSQNQEPLNTVFSAETAGKNIDSFVNKHKKAIGAAVLAITIFVGGMIFQNNRSETTVNQPETELPAGEEEEIKVPREAKDFVEQYSTRYGGVEDTISVYYSNEAYKKANSGKSLILTDDYVNSFVHPEDRAGEIAKISDHGFYQYQLDKGVVMDLQTSQKIFNEYMAPQLSLYLNLLAKNPNPDAMAIIDREFYDYCSTPRLVDDEMFKELKSFAYNIVYKYGNGATYTIKPIQIGESEVSLESSQMSSFAVPQNWQDDYYTGMKTDFSATLADRVVIDIDQYEGKEHSTERNTIYNFQMEFMRKPTNAELDNTTPISIGLGAPVKNY